MKSYRIFLIPVFFLFLLAGCATPPHPGTASKNTPAPASSLSEDEESAIEAEITDEESLADAEEDADSLAACDPSDKEKSDAAGDTDEDAPDTELSLQMQPEFDEVIESCDKAHELWKAGESEKAMDSLDHAYSLILEIDTQEDPELGRQKEDLRFMISKRILEIYASRNIAVKGNHNEIPLTMNHHVEAEIALLTSPGRDDHECFFFKAYRRAGRYQAAIAEEFKKAGLPVELAWLPLIESGFQTNTLSPARALGIWQFIPSTGYKYGLKRDRYVDERMDPEKSTQAAIEYLKELHQMFGDWTTVLAAYNCGEGRVLQVIRQQNINYLDNFWDLYERLPRETARYVPRFLATLHIIGNPEKYGLDKIPPQPPMEYETVGISKMISLSDVAQTIGTNKDTLASLNPELRHQIVPGSNYPLKVPKNASEVLLTKLDQIPVSSPPQLVREAAYQYHKVKRGESFAGIARQYRISSKKLARANGFGKHRRVVVGDILKVPQSKSAAYASASDDESGSKDYFRYKVKKGDSVANIAKRYGISASEIYEFNRLSKKKVRVGQTLKIPGDKKISKKSVSERKIYRVKDGDSLKDIAKQHHMPLEKFLRVNNMTQRSKIYPGQQLYVE
jgi:membrane-bound lytic murein transglycosylase D